MELDFSQMALEVSHHGYLLVTRLTTQNTPVIHHSTRIDT